MQDCTAIMPIVDELRQPQARFATVHGPPMLAPNRQIPYILGDDTAHLHNHLTHVNADGTSTFIDLFAGCGGLSLGLEKAGFRSVLAVEKSEMAAETYYHNFIKRLPSGDLGKREWADYCQLPLNEQVRRGLAVNELGNVLSNSGVLDELRLRDIDLVAGIFRDVAQLATVDATIEKELAAEHDVKGFPTLKFYHKGQVGDALHALQLSLLFACACAVAFSKVLTDNSVRPSYVHFLSSFRLCLLTVARFAVPRV